MAKLQSLGVVVGDELGQVKFLQVRLEDEVREEPEEEAAGARASTNRSSVLHTVYTPNSRLAVQDLIASSSAAHAGAPMQILASRGWKKKGRGVVNTLRCQPGIFANLQDTEHELETLTSPVRLFEMGRSTSEELAVAYDNQGYISPINSNDDSKGFKVEGPVSTAVGAPSSMKFAVGGKENDLHVYDYGTQQAVFRARNVPHDKLDMRVPVWVTGISFMSASEQVLATCTGYAQVRVYDIRAQRRPVKDLGMKEWSHMTGIVRVGEDKVVISDTEGHVSRLDLTSMRFEAKYKGFAGGVRSLHVHPEAPFLVAGGLDRFVHIHHLHSRKMCRTVYVKQKLNVVRFCTQLDVCESKTNGEKRGLQSENSDGPVPKKPKDVESDSGEDDDQVHGLSYNRSSSDNEVDSDSELGSSSGSDFSLHQL